MPPGERFKALIGEVIAPKLTARGYQRSGQGFYLGVSGNWGVINFQRSTSSTRDAVRFTINLGVSSARLTRYLSPAQEGRKPSIWDRHWRERIGWLLPARQDVWRTVDGTTEMGALADELRQHVCELAVPEVGR